MGGRVLQRLSAPPQDASDGTTFTASPKKKKAPGRVTLADQQRLGRYLAILILYRRIPPGHYEMAPLVKVTPRA